MAAKVLEVARSLSKGSDELLLSMLYPSDSHSDDNPVFMLCRNDTCSFTWTGEEHIYQVCIQLCKGWSTFGIANFAIVVGA